MTLNIDGDNAHEDEQPCAAADSIAINSAPEGGLSAPVSDPSPEVREQGAKPIEFEERHNESELDRKTREIRERQSELQKIGGPPPEVMARVGSDLQPDESDSPCLSFDLADGSSVNSSAVEWVEGYVPSSMIKERLSTMASPKGPASKVKVASDQRVFLKVCGSVNRVIPKDCPAGMLPAYSEALEAMKELLTVVAKRDEK